MRNKNPRLWRDQAGSRGEKESAVVAGIFRRSSSLNIYRKTEQESMKKPADGTFGGREGETVCVRYDS